VLGPVHDQHGDAVTPRASLIARVGELPALAANVWMGGAHTPHGEDITVEGLAAAWLLDCAGDMPAAHRSAAGRWIACVFPDLDGHPLRFARIQELATEAATAVRHGHTTDLYIVCQHGMNRSGLVTGLVLRELGLSGPDALERILAARPGALSNVAFRRLVLG